MGADVKTVSVAQMRAADAYTIERFTPSRELMRRAAQGVYDSVPWQGRVAVICGGGNNGGDGFALAGILARSGIVPDVWRTSDKLSEDGSFYCAEAERLGVAVSMFEERTSLSGYDIIVDCILGTGFAGAPRGLAAAAITRINESQAYVVSVDINSGMDGDTGAATLAVRSDLTVSIGAYKSGMLAPATQEYIGSLVNVDIGIVFPE